MLLGVSACCAVALDPAKPIGHYRHEVWEETEGLPHYTINSISQDRDGYLWLGTYYGAVRFDGKQFVVFDTSNTPELKTNQVWTLAKDQGGVLWMGTGRGLVRYSSGQFTNYPTPSSARVLLPVAGGQVWMGTSGDGLWSMRGGKLAQVGLAGETVRALAADPQGGLWAGTHQGLYCYRGGRFQRFSTKDGLPDDRVISLHFDDEGTLWVGTRSGIAYVKNSRVVGFGPQTLARQTIWTIESDRDRNVWIGTLAGGIIRATRGKFSYFNNPDPLASRAITAIFEDREGALWVGANGGGLSRFRDVAFYTATTDDGLNSNLVQAVHAARDGRIWVGFNSAGITRLSPDLIEHDSIRRRDGLSSDGVWSICEDHWGDMWFGTFNGELNRLHNGKIRTFRPRDGLPGTAILTISESRNGDLWVGTLSNGLGRMRGGTFKTFHKSDGLASDQVRVVHEDRAGRLWIGTNHGLTVYEDGRFKTFTKRNGLSGDFVLSIYEDTSGTLWIGTFDGGLTRIRDGRFTQYGLNSGFPAEVVFQVLEDNHDNLWVSSSTGIFRVSKRELEAFANGTAPRIRSDGFEISEGLNSRECNGGRPAGTRSADGRLWFPTMKGLAVVDPDKIPFNPNPPPVVIENCLADTKECRSANGKIVLPAGIRNIEFKFSALSLLVPGKVRFRYRLNPYDTDWVDSGTRRSANYTNLAPGNYSLQVIAANNDGVWNKTGASMEMRIEPHFYQTRWFYILCAIAVVAIAWVVHRIRMRRVVRLNAELEARVAARTSSLAEANGQLNRAVEELNFARARAEEASKVRAEFVANVSHEIRTPINGIMGLTALVLETELGEEQREYLGLARKAAESLMSVLDGVLDFSKIDAGHLTIEAIPFPVRTTIEDAVQILGVRAQDKGLTLGCEFARGLPEVLVGDPSRLRQILLNLVGNAIKFTSKGGVTVRTEVDSAAGNRVSLHFGVADTGIGIPPEKQAVIFEPFRQADNSTTRRFGGTGLGLGICVRLVEAMGGRMWVESGEDVGSTFHFTVSFERHSGAPASALRETLNAKPASVPPLHILLAEDNQVNQIVAARLLERQGCTVEIVGNGAEAVARVASRSYDLVLMDVHMPELDGWAATNQIRKLEESTGRHTPIIAMTALAMTGDAERCLAAGMDAYVPKPLDIQRLMETINAVVATQHPSGEPLATKS